MTAKSVSKAKPKKLGDAEAAAPKKSNSSSKAKPKKLGDAKAAAPKKSISSSKAKPKKLGDAKAAAPKKSISSRKVAERALGIWNDNETVTGQWSTSEDKNSWMWINDNENSPNSGWKRLSNVSDSGNLALTILASHAKQVGSNVSYRSEDDEMVHEMYVW